MFEQAFVQTQAQTRKPWTVAVSLSAQCLAVAVLFILPLLHTQALHMPDPPAPHISTVWLNQPPAPPTAASQTPKAVLSAPAQRREVFLIPNAHAPIGHSIDLPSADPEPAMWSGPVGASLVSSLVPGPSLPRAESPKPVIQPETKSVVSGPVRISGGLEAAKLIFGPHPVYPQLAKMARSQGTVKLEATIAANGSIRDLRVVSGPPLLVNAAVEAVRQWRYQPTLLNGGAVEVLTEIDVNFTLN